jgi:outer membrane receptor protein involved in Fe transport
MAAFASTCVFLTIASTQVAVTSSSAREEDEQASKEIIVTGERRAEPAQKTTSSVVVIRGDSIDRSAGTATLTQVLAEVPNVGPDTGSRGVTIRGQDSTGVLRDLAAFIGGTQPRVAVQVDGRPLSYFEYVFGTMPVWDLEQIEVFRSPQTTTQGRNAASGAIFLSTRDPSFVWRAGIRLIAGSSDQRQASLVLNGPIIADQLAFRISGDLKSSRPASHIADLYHGIDPDHEDFGTVRAKLLATPTAISALRIEANYVHLRSKRPQIAGVRAPFKERRDTLPSYGIFRHNVDSLTAIVDFDPSGRVSSRSTLSFGDVHVRRFAQSGLGEALIHSRDYSGETVLRWKDVGPLTVLGGINSTHLALKQQIDVTRLVGVGGFQDDQNSLGLFADATLEKPAFTLTGGMRYQRDSQNRRGQIGPYPVAFDHTYQAWLPRLSAAWNVTDKIITGVQMQRAYTPGGMSLDLGTGRTDIFEAERLWSYEAFARASLAGGAVQLSSNLFYTTIRNAQRPQTREVLLPGGGSTSLVALANAPRARTYGLEAEAKWRRSDRLEVRAGIGLLNTRILETASLLDPIRGKQFERAPKLSASAALDWAPTSLLRVNVQLRHNSRYFSDDANTPGFRIAANNQFNGRIDYKIGPFTAFGFVQNAFDRFTLLQQIGASTGVVGRAREFGFGANAAF